MEGFLVKISNYKKTKNTQYWHLLNGPVTKVLVREKIGRPLKILVLQWTIFPWNIGLGDHFFRDNWSGGPFFSGEIGPGDHFFSGNIGLGGTIFSGKLVRGTILFRVNWSGKPFLSENIGLGTIFQEKLSGRLIFPEKIGPPDQYSSDIPVPRL